jgi:hypothetical protein
MADPSEATQVSGTPTEPAEEELLEAVRALATQVGALREELHALRAEPPSLPTAGAEQHGWEEAPAVPRDGGSWVRSLDAPTQRRPAIPWLLLEILFLVAVAVLAAVAGLGTAAIVGVMALAWLVVAVAEWSARATQRRFPLANASFRAAASPLPEDRSWLAPPAERTALDLAGDTESAGARLPPAVAE